VILCDSFSLTYCRQEKHTGKPVLRRERAEVVKNQTPLEGEERAIKEIEKGAGHFHGA
jgi:hypothetical protein